MLYRLVLAALLLSGCTSFTEGARGFFGAMNALDRGFQQSGVTQAAANGLLNPYPAPYTQQTTVVQQPTYQRPVGSMVPYVPPATVQSPQPRSLSGMW